MYITSVDGYLQILIALISTGASLSSKTHPHVWVHPEYAHHQPHHYCGANEIGCVSGGCIDRRTACDGIYHCPDGSDETAILCQKQECPWYMFRCAYGACTKISSVCNGVYDCVDKSDEPPTHSCHLDPVPPAPTVKPTSKPSTTSTKSTTKHYTPFPYGPTTSSKRPESSPPPIHTPPATTKTSTTKHYTPLTVPTTSATTQSTKTPTTTSNNQRHTTESRGTTTTYSPTTPKPTPTVTSEKSTTSAPSANTCKLPPRTSDKTYKIDGCEAGSSDAICHAEPGESIVEGAALNFACNSNAKSFTTYCLKGDWVPAVSSFSCETSDCGNLTTNFRANTHVPWQVGIYDRSSDQFTCQGVIVSPYVITSAAQCFFDTTTNQQRTHSEFYITVGKKSRHKNAARSQIYNVTEIRFPPNGFQGSVGDIALLEVTPAILYSTEVGSCCVDTSADQYSDEETAGVVSAYNDNGGNGYTETARVTITSYEKCVQIVEDGSKSLVTSDKICIVGQSIELGNTGNGLYTLKGAGTSSNSQYRLRAIFSTVFYDSKSSAQIITLTDVGKHLSWLPDALNEMNQSHENETLIDIRGPFSLL